ncbi:L,D-transpeptidase family protein [Sporohalobacter salinus]|uniref:L,D-transpeptidase family protein n=1 Tax=Sporohalobacter salinus TaxID=1494606 RepID=UPI00195FBD80|nr:hypothetical protein [Sporohalobacter salinus]
MNNINKKILINLNQRYLELYQNSELFGHYPVAVGKDSTSTPTGNFEVILKRKNPGGALGSRWIQFTWQSHGIHGTNQPWLIGQAVSHGCVRMYNSDVEEVYRQVQVGTPIHIYSNIKSNPNPNYTIYKVQPEDTLYKIAHKFNTSVTKLIEINQLKNPDLIYPNQKLKIPK